MFDEQPDGDIHGECAAEIHKLEAENTALRAELAALKARDVVMVPREPTMEMLKEAVMQRHGTATYRCVSTSGLEALEEEAAEDYRAMIAAAEGKK
jgi:cell division protein FtsB